MAVVPPGFFGDYFAQYGQMNDSRTWNTKSYDYSVVKNKGEIGEEAKNENTTAPTAPDTDPLYGKGLFADANKFAYVNAAGALVEEKNSPIYQIRNHKGFADNAYYVDQNKGDVYLRPRRSGATGITLPALSPVNNITPQYFGTVFDLEEPPNPEDFGSGKLSNITLTVTSSAIPANESYNEMTINGVPVSSGDNSATPFNLNTAEYFAGGGVLPLTDALYAFSNSFTVGSDNFSPISGTWTYVPNAGNGYYESTAVGQASFNPRTVDNFLMNVTISGGDTGIHLRANTPDDSIGASGYYLKYTSAGSFELYKAGITGPLTLLNPAPTVAFGSPIQIRMNGTEIIVNNVSIFKDNNPSLYGKPFTDGYLSLRSETTAARRFDTFELSSYPKAIQLISRALQKGENSIVVRGYDTAALTVDVTGNIRDNRRGAPFDINIGTTNIPPDLQAFNGNNPLSSTSRMYRNDAISGFDTELDEDRAYWSVSQKSALGIAGKIVFINKEGGSLQKTRNQFTDVNNLMQNLTSLLGSQDDLFNSTLGIIR